MTKTTNPIDAFIATRHAFFELHDRLTRLIDKVDVQAIDKMIILEELQKSLDRYSEALEKL